MKPSPVEIFVLDRAVRLLQPAEGFRTSLDSVMLAAACPAGDGETVVDMGCGVGGAAFCLLHRVPGISVTGVDNHPDYIDLAERNIELNAVRDRVHFVCTDVARFDVKGPSHRFHHAICNPPYLEAGRHTPSPRPDLAVARGHGDGGDMALSDWIDAGFRLIRPGGSLTMIHRADRVDELIQALGRRFGATEIIPLWPRAGELARRVIVRTLKDRRSPAAIHPGIVLHEVDGAYTKAADDILRRVAALL